METFNNRRGFISRLGASVAAPATGVLLGACGGGSDTAVAANQVQFITPVIPDGIIRAVTSADGTKVIAYEYGNPNGRPIIFIHGFSQCYLSWAKQFTDSSLKSKYRMIAIDLRGHGNSDKPSKPYLPIDQANDVKAVIDSLSLTNATLVGWSFGGQVIMDYLNNYGLQTTLGAVFVGSGVGDRSGQKTTFLGQAAVAATPGMTGLDFATGIVTPPSPNKNLNATLDFIKAVTQNPISNDDLAMALAYSMMATPMSRLFTLSRVDASHPPQDYDESILPLMKASAYKSLVIHGDSDRIVLTAGGDFIANAAGSEKKIYAATGHSPMIENSNQFNQDLAAFVG